MQHNQNILLLRVAFLQHASQHASLAFLTHNPLQSGRYVTYKQNTNTCAFSLYAWKISHQCRDGYRIKRVKVHGKSAGA